MQNLQALLKYLVKSPLDFVLVGGFAAVLHGCNQTTRDIDICLAVSPERIAYMRELLGPLNPRHRMTTDKLSFLEHPRDGLERIRNIYLETDLGVLDVISSVEAVGEYNELRGRAVEIVLFDSPCHIISIDDLITSKRSLARHKDLMVVAELEQIKIEDVGGV